MTGEKNPCEHEYRCFFIIKQVWVLHKYCQSIKTLNPQRNAHSLYSVTAPSNKPSGLSGCHSYTLTPLSRTPNTAVAAKRLGELMQKCDRQRLLRPVRIDQSQQTTMRGALKRQAPSRRTEVLQQGTVIISGL